MANEPLIETPPRHDRSTTPARAQTIVCEFCECKVSLRGRLLWRSEKAKAILDLDEDVDKLRKQVAALEAENTRLTEKITKLESPRIPERTTTTRKAWNVGDEDE